MEGPIQCRYPVYLLKDSNGLEEEEKNMNLLPSSNALNSATI